MASAARKQDFVPIRFYVEWHPTAEIEAECIKQGMTPDDGSSFWDWVEIPDHAKMKVFQDFGAAVEFALSIASQDCFGCARVYRQQQVVVKDGKRSFIRWDDECFWDGINGTDQPDINKPDEWCA
jgi:hypothetical protein